MAGPGSYRLGKEELKELMDVMESGYLFRYGDPNNPKFKQKVNTLEREFARMCGVEYALATSSGTSALLVSLLALGIKPGDEVIVPAYTFVATYSAVIFAGAIPVLTEIDNSLTIDTADIERRITPKTKAIIPVHMLGNPCNMDAIMDVARKHGLPVLEDACQACGGSYKGRRLGSIGEMGAFSLNVFKTITAGDGGAVATADKELYARAFACHDQGHSPHRTGVEVGNRTIFGLNFRMNELTGAVALAQLRKIDNIIATLHTKKNKFKALLDPSGEFSFRILYDPAGECSTLCTVIFDTTEKAKSVASTLKTKTVDNSGWHVYANMEHIASFLKKAGQPYGLGAYPRTDDILSRAINLSVGVVDGGLGSGFGINIDSTDEEIAETARIFNDACR